MKPISPKQARRPVVGSEEHREHLKKLVTLRLNRVLKKGLREIDVPNYVEPDLVQEIIDDYQAEGWVVAVEDCRRTHLDTAWRFVFAVEYSIGEVVEVDMIDRESWPDIFDGKVLDVQPTGGTNEKRYQIEYQDAAGTAQTMWLVDRYLARKEQS